MSSTSCNLYWVNITASNVTAHVTNISAKCDSSFTSCTFPASKSNGFTARDSYTCTNNLMYPAKVASDDKSGYICSCGAQPLSPPDPKILSCTDACFKLNNDKKCSFISLSLNSNPTFGQSGSGEMTGSQCSSLRCGSGNDARVCTDEKGSYQYICNNQMQWGITDSSSGYVCNCNGAATVPNGFGPQGKKDECKGQKISSTTTSTSSSSRATNTGSPSSSSAASPSASPAGNSATTAKLSMKTLVGFMSASVFIMGLMA